MHRDDEEEKLLRSVAIQNAQSILRARQRAEEELERANELIRTIAENAASALLMLDEEGRATYMNPAAIQATGYEPEEFSRAAFHEMLHPPVEQGGHPIDICPIRLARENGSPLRKHRDLFVRKDGSTFPVSCSLSPLQTQGRAGAAVLEFRDITEELLAQKTLEDANRRKDQFLATLSHELRTPMTAVLGWARMLELGLPGINPQQAIAAIRQSAEIQAQLIDDVLDVSRIVAGKMTFVPVAVDLGLVLRAAMTTVHPAATAKGIEILASVPPALPAVLGDEGRLQQVFWNLLSNAVKFTPRGGAVTIRAAEDDSMVRVMVQDSGKGIDPDFLPHVFEAFTQQDASSTRAHEGIGLGLSIARSLVELHGGRIRAASEGAGSGATFTVEFPVISSQKSSRRAANASAPAATPATLTMPSLRDVTVLVVDDHDSMRDLIVSILKRADATVRAAKSVRHAIEEVAAHPPNVVVCDLAMPEQDGYDFLRALRASSSSARDTPVIALTAFGRPEDRLRALKEGFDDYLKKPVEPEDLASAVLRLANR
jgi:PAS domain S-box-containing protein